MTTANPQHARPGRLSQAWRGFRRWRRSRPFWGGLLTALAGVEIFSTTQMSLSGLTFQTGPTGFLSWLIPVILVACGMLMWFTPQQRMFYAIVGAVTAVFSLIGVNLGGFFVGLLLGMVGSALGFAWVPSRRPVADPAAAAHCRPGAGRPAGRRCATSRRRRRADVPVGAGRGRHRPAHRHPAPAPQPAARAVARRPGPTAAPRCSGGGRAGRPAAGRPVRPEAARGRPGAAQRLGRRGARAARPRRRQAAAAPCSAPPRSPSTSPTTVTTVAVPPRRRQPQLHPDAQPGARRRAAT